MSRKSGLGKGLEALFVENINPAKEPLVLDINKIEPNKNQPRKHFNSETLEILAESIRVNGIIQPILVREIDEGKYQIVAGERRYKAAKMAGLGEVPVIVKEIEDYKVTELALIENLQREDLNPIEEATSFLMLVEKYGLTQDEVSKKVGRSRSAITNSIRLLNLPKEVIKEIEGGRLSSGQARALLSIKDEEELKDMAKKVIERGMSVREIERLVSLKKEVKNSKKAKKEEQESIYKDLEKDMQDKLKRNVKIKVMSGEKGRITIDFYNREELVFLAHNLTFIT